MDADELKNRTKRFALRILKLAAALPPTIEGNIIEGSWSGLVLQLVLTIELHVGVVRARNLQQRLVWWKKKLTKVRFGSNLLLKLLFSR